MLHEVLMCKVSDRGPPAALLAQLDFHHAPESTFDTKFAPESTFDTKFAPDRCLELCVSCASEPNLSGWAGAETGE
jgi:hypothetical protein